MAVIKRLPKILQDGKILVVPGPKNPKQDSNEQNNVDGNDQSTAEKPADDGQAKDQPTED